MLIDSWHCNIELYWLIFFFFVFFLFFSFPHLFFPLTTSSVKQFTCWETVDFGWVLLDSWQCNMELYWSKLFLSVQTCLLPFYRFHVAIYWVLFSVQMVGSGSSFLIHSIIAYIFNGSIFALTICVQISSSLKIAPQLLFCVQMVGSGSSFVFHSILSCIPYRSIFVLNICVKLSNALKIVPKCGSHYHFTVSVIYVFSF